MPLYIEPNAGPAPIIQVIQSARREISAGVYYLADRPILKALKAAHARGVDVRVIIEGKPYGIKPWQVRKEEKAIEATGATLHLAPYRFTSHGNHYAFQHSKYLCSGHECEIGTANFDWSALGHKNREYLYVTRNVQVVNATNAVFNADWHNRHAPAYAHQVLVLSPGTSAAQIIGIIDQPGPVDIESEELGPYAPTLDAIAAKGALARVILPASINSIGKKDVAFLRSHSVQVRLMPKSPVYMHAKMLVGGSEAFVGSENFSRTSLQVNREMGLLLGGRDIGELQAQFDRDWNRAN
ncbi:phospholipase D-like domain-containing protein [Acidithiobacillus ferruginosus]|uniref:Phospholipase D-like domain-containing protein n=1 Tax=Acidithiobacillus ferruginosus TaxID=3063951 RepID=A0ACD5IEY7_9PROT|nr:phospholipase D-like domain-containing protein [Acidithiobacillus ferruginosus]MBU2813550.1 GTP-binding protein [Acidithiobacillus ferruginosus]